MSRRLLPGLLLATACLGTGLVTPVSAAVNPTVSAAVNPTGARRPGPVVLIGTAGLRWDDVSDTTPALHGLLSSGAIGTLDVGDGHAFTCPVDGWLTVSAGTRATGTRATGTRTAGTGDPCPAPTATVSTAGGSATTVVWSADPTSSQRQAPGSASAGRPGWFGTALKGRRPTAAVGPGAVIALADAGGRVDHAWPGIPPGPGGGIDPLTDASDLSDQVRAAVASGAELVVVDTGAVRDQGDLGPGGQPAVDAPTREAQVTALDTRLQLVLGELPAGATAFVASLADSGVTAHLQVIAAAGSADREGGGRPYTGALLATTTGPEGLAAITDLAPTLLDALGERAPGGPAGELLRPGTFSEDPTQRLERVLDLDLAVRAGARIAPVLLTVSVLANLALLAAAVAVLRGLRHPVGRPRAFAVLRRVAVVVAAVPAATFLVALAPWWRDQNPAFAAGALVAVFTLVTAAPALLGPWRNAVLGPLAVLGGLTAAILAADVLTGSRLSLSSLLAGPARSGAWSGFGPAMSALFVAGALLAAAGVRQALVDRGRQRPAAGTVVAVGVAAAVVAGAPGLGGDPGVAVTSVTCTALLNVRLPGRLRERRGWRSPLALAGASAAVAVAAWVVVRAITGWGTGGTGTSGTGVAGLVSPLVAPLVVLAPLAAAFLVLALARPAIGEVRPLPVACDRTPALRGLLLALGTLVVLATVLPDAGAVVPGAVVLLVVPLLLAASVRALELDAADRLEAAVAAARRPPRRPPRPQQRRAPRPNRPAAGG